MLKYKLMKKPIYLIGPLRNFSSTQQEEYEKARAAIAELHQCTVLSSIDEYKKLNFEGVEGSKDQLMRTRISNLMDSGMAVLMQDFEYDVEASFEFRLAKFLNIHTIGINFALKTESTNGKDDRNPSRTEPSNASDQQS